MRALEEEIESLREKLNESKPEIATDESTDKGKYRFVGELLLNFDLEISRLKAQVKMSQVKTFEIERLNTTLKERESKYRTIQ